MLRFMLLGLVFLSWLLVSPRVAMGQQVLFTADFLAVVVEPGKTAELDVTVENKGEQGQAVSLGVESPPPGWKWSFNQSFPPLEVRRLYVKPGKEQELRFKAEPPDEVAAREYDFLLVAQVEGGERLPLKITVVVKAAEEAEAGKVRLEATYDALSVPSGSTVEYRLQLFNDTSEDRSFDLFAQAPEGWRVRFKPEFENKYVTSLSLLAKQSKGINAEVSPPPLIEAGNYQLSVTARSEEQELTRVLRAEILGTYQLSLDTSTGRLNTKATAGRVTTISLVVSNQGSAPLEDITFTTAEPREWQVTLIPDKVEFLEARQAVEVQAELVPAEKAIPGDYMVGIRASGSAGQTVDDLELRVTVLSGTAWGWVGVGIVVVVLAILGGLFVRLGRR